MWRTILVSGLLAVIASGCASTAAERCEPQERYEGAGSIAPLRIPDELAPPDETGALRIPLESAPDATETAVGHCIESPPPYQSPSSENG